MSQSYSYPSSSTVTVAAVGVNGQPAPNQSIEVAGVDPSGNLHPLQTDASGNLLITDTSGVVRHVIVDSSALPAGASTSALQTSGNASLASIDSKTTSQTYDVSGTLINMNDTSGEAFTNGASTVSIQSTGTWSGLIEFQGSADGINWSHLPLYETQGGGAQRYISFNSLYTCNVGGCLKTRFFANTSLGGTATLTVHGNPGNGSDNVISASAEAFFVSANVRDGSGNPISSTGGRLYVDVSASAPPTGSATAANQATEIASLASIDSKLTSPLTVTGPLTDTQLRATPVPVSGTVSTGGLTDTQLRATPVPVSVSGVATAALQGTGNTSLASIDSKTPALGQAAMAASVPVVIASNQSNLPVNNAQINGVTPLMGNGVTGTGSQRVTIASDNTPFSVNTNTPVAGTVTSTALTVGTTAVRLTVSGSAPSATRKLLAVTPDSTSTATFYIGPAGVTNSGATRGVQIVGGQPFVANNDAGDYYIVSSVASQTVFITEQS